MAEASGVTEDAQIATYNVEKEVCRIWLEEPGIGVTALLQELMRRFPPEEHGYPKKKSVKRAKDAVPYRRLPDAHDAPKNFDQESFVQTKLEQRISYRSSKHWEQADRISKGLKAMGIRIDDRYRTWTLGKPLSAPEEAQEALKQSVNDGVPCSMCGRYFGSRNLVFAHLRDPSSGCGTSIFATGQSIAMPPSNEKKLSKKAARPQRGRKTGGTAHHADADSCLWVSDLPLVWTRHGGQYRRLRALLFAHTPKGVPQPWIKKVVRKAYRNKQEGHYLGYAIVVFRDADEAAFVMKEMNGIEVSAQTVYSPEQLQNYKEDLTSLIDAPPFNLKVCPAKTSDSVAAMLPRGLRNHDGKPVAGLDPPLSDQLRPLGTDELCRRTDRLRQKQTTKGDGDNFHHREESKCRREQMNHDETLALAVAQYNAGGPRREIRLKGRPVPIEMCKRLLSLLEALRWPAMNQRQGLSADRYLVLQTNTTNDPFYKELREACRDLMEWADPEYYYSGIAVTKNFTASPHIDDRDQSFQYAIALGTFEKGGELCVEGDDQYGSDWVNVVETRNRIARVDGRHVHWVRTWDGGDRYSLIFYDTSDRKPTQVNSAGVDLKYLKGSDS